MENRQITSARGRISLVGALGLMMVTTQALPGIGCAQSAVTHYLRYDDLPDPIIVGDKLSFLVTAGTKTSSSPHSSTVNSHARGYQLQVGLVPESNRIGEVKIIGPIWSHDGPSSMEANDNDPAYNRAAISETGRKPFVFKFSPDGRLIKSEVESPTKWRHWSLVPQASDAFWNDTGTQNRLRLIPIQLFDSHFQSLSCHYVVQQDIAGRVNIYDTIRKVRLEDSWLEAAAADLFSRDDLANSTVTLTEDLKYIVVFPGSHAKYENFVVSGESFPRNTYGVVYERNESCPKVFSGLREDQSHHPFVPYSTFAGLCFLEYSDACLTLRSLDGKPLVSFRFDKTKSWLKDFGVSVTHDAIQHEMRFILLPPLQLCPDIEKVPDQLHVLVWLYKPNSINEYAIETGKWFRVRPDGYYPSRSSSTVELIGID